MDTYTMLSVLVIGILLLLLLLQYVKHAAVVSVPQQLYLEEYGAILQAVSIWIRDERAYAKFFEEVSGDVGDGWLVQLSNINFKTILHSTETMSHLDALLVDTEIRLIYSRFLDLYHKQCTLRDPSFITLYSTRYFKNYALLDTPYKYTKKQCVLLKDTYPYLWLLNIIADVYISERGSDMMNNKQQIVATDRSQLLRTPVQQIPQEQ